MDEINGIESVIREFSYKGGLLDGVLLFCWWLQCVESTCTMCMKIFGWLPLLWQNGFSIVNVQAGLLSLCKKLNQKAVIYDLINRVFWNMLLYESLILKQSYSGRGRKPELCGEAVWSRARALPVVLQVSRNKVCVIPEHQRVKRGAWSHFQSASTRTVLPTCCITSPRGVVSGASVGRIDKGSYSLTMIENF